MAALRFWLRIAGLVAKSVWELFISWLWLICCAMGGIRRFELWADSKATEWRTLLDDGVKSVLEVKWTKRRSYSTTRSYVKLCLAQRRLAKSGVAWKADTSARVYLAAECIASIRIHDWRDEKGMTPQLDGEPFPATEENIIKFFEMYPQLALIPIQWVNEENEGIL